MKYFNENMSSEEVRLKFFSLAGQLGEAEYEILLKEHDQVLTGILQRESKENADYLTE